MVAICLAIIALVLNIRLVGKVDAAVENFNAKLGSIGIDAYTTANPSSGQWTAFDNVLTGELRVASSTFTSVVTFNATTTQQGLSCVNVSGTFNDASTTFISTGNGNLFGATSTVHNFRAYVTGVSTTTIVWSVGTSSTRFGNPGSVASTSGTIINELDQATNTLATLIQGAAQPDYTATSSVVVLGTNEFIVAHGQAALLGDNDNGGILGNSNTFAGTYKYGICR